MRSLVIGIAGGTASGKSTLTQALATRFAGDVTVISHDSYYRAHNDIPFSQRQQLNYDAPEAFDNDLLVEHLQQLLRGQEVHSPTYDFVMHNRTAETKLLTPSRLILVEGILIFAEPRICELCQIKIFVDTDADVRILRRIERDVAGRGRSLQSVTQQYLTTVKPMHDLYVEPSKRKADLIVPEGGENLVALEMLIHRIERALS